MEPQNNIIEPTNKKHRILLITLIILLTAAIIGGGTYYFLNQQIKKQNELITELEKNNKKIEDNRDKKTEQKDQNSNAEIKKEPDIRKANLKKAVEDEIIALNIYTKSTVLDGSAMTVSVPQFADLTGDGNEEAVIASIDTGSGSCNRTFVFNYKNSVLTKLAFFDVPKDSQCHNAIKIEGSYLVESYSIYKEGDSNCCPTGGTKKVYYRWDKNSYIKFKEEKI